MVFESKEKEKRRRKKGKLKVRIELENKVYIFELSGWRRYILAILPTFILLAILNWVFTIPKVKELKKLQEILNNKLNGDLIVVKAEEMINQIEELELAKEKLLENIGEKGGNSSTQNNNNDIFSPKFTIASIEPGINSSMSAIANSPVEVIKRLENIKEDIKVISEKIKRKNTIIEYLPTIKPVRGYITSKFGPRFHPIEKEEKFHTGIDIAAPYGSPVYATASGKVIRARRTNSGKGNFVMIKHINNIMTIYLHLSRITVKEGQFVKKGEIIGYVGSSGTATGPHLHYEVLYNGKPIDPLIFMLED